MSFAHARVVRIAPPGNENGLVGAASNQLTVVLRELLAAGVDLGLGTDGSASNNDLDLWQEIDTAAKLSPTEDCA